MASSATGKSAPNSSLSSKLNSKLNKVGITLSSLLLVIATSAIAVFLVNSLIRHL